MQISAINGSLPNIPSLEVESEMVVPDSHLRLYIKAGFDASGGLLGVQPSHCGSSDC